jgi:hypothetical protein
MEQKLVILNELNLKEINTLLSQGFNIGLTYQDQSGQIFIQVYKNIETKKNIRYSGKGDI